MKKFLTIVRITYGDFIRRIEILMVSALGMLFVTGICIVLIDDEMAKQVLSGIKQASGAVIQTGMLIEGGLVYSEIFVVIVAFLIGMNLLSRDIKSNAIGLYLAKPISRDTYLLGKFVGGVLVAYTVMAIYLTVLFVALMVKGQSGMLPYMKIISLSMFKITLLFSIILVLNQRVHPFVASLIGSLIYIGGYFVGRLLIVSISADGLVKYSSLFTYYALPHLTEVSSGSLMDVQTGTTVLLKWLVVYGILYSGLLLSGAILMFRAKSL